jgi:nitronate monooxygenase
VTGETSPGPQALTTAWSRSQGLEVPILNAPMGGAAGGRLAAAVSSAGGLGMIGVGSGGSIELLERESAVPREAGVRFGIGLLAWAVEREPELLNAAVTAGPDLIAVSFGDPQGWPERVRDAGIATATQVYDVATARRAEELGIDVLIARGSEGGGHGTDGVATLPLLQGVLDSVSVPVLAAGGIATGRGLAAVLAAGAAGAWLGTAFAACSESILPDQARRRLISAGESDTVYTRSFDVALGYPWPARYGERVLANAFSERWTGREHELEDESLPRDELRRAAGAGDYSVLPVNAGQGVGSVSDVRPVADVLGELSSSAASLVRTWNQG